MNPEPPHKKWIVYVVRCKDGSLYTGITTELERRLRARGTESEEAIARRLEVARRELARANKYKYQVVNDTVDRAVDEISRILNKLGIVDSNI